MTDRTDPRARKGRAELLALQLNIRLVAEGLGVQARKDRRALSGQAHREAVERRRAVELRRRPSYASAEAREPFIAETKLIRAADRPAIETGEIPEVSPRRLTYSEMRARQEEYPAIPDEAREYQRRRREERRRRNGKGGRPGKWS